MYYITTCTEILVDDTNKPTSDDKYPWLESDDIRRNMTDSEILRMKLNLKDSVLDENRHMPFYRGTFKIKRQNIILCKTIPNERRTKESHTKRNGQTRAFRHYSERIFVLSLQ